MKRKHLAIGLGLFFTLSGACFASTQTKQGVIRFYGNIVAPPCVASTASDGLTLHGCPSTVRGAVISIHSAVPARSVNSLDQPSAHVRLVEERNEQRGTFSQHFAVLDAANLPVKSGNYVVTLTYP